MMHYVICPAMQPIHIIVYNFRNCHHMKLIQA